MAFEKHLFVDAANVLHAWPESRALLRRDRWAARSWLVQRLSALHDSESVLVTVVIDGRGDEIVIEHPSKQATLTIVHTPSSLTADDVIEQMVARSPDPARCEVATDDQAERDTIEAAGAVWVPAADLLVRIERSGQRINAKVASINRANTQNWRNR